MERPGLFRERIGSGGFTLTEIIIVVVVLGIMISLSVPTYLGSREKSLDKEAVTALRLIRAANRQYFSQREAFYPPSGSVSAVAHINGNLSIDLNANQWTYTVSGAPTFSATAVRNSGAARTWQITLTTEPSCTGACV